MDKNNEVTPFWNQVVNYDDIPDPTNFDINDYITKEQMKEKKLRNELKIKIGRIVNIYVPHMNIIRNWI